jgi:hypothetical protein
MNTQEQVTQAASGAAPEGFADVSATGNPLAEATPGAG